MIKGGLTAAALVGEQDPLAWWRAAARLQTNP
jgi:hypothetical protein